jgi:hypothetical protein
MNTEKTKNQAFINFENINLEDIQEIDEIVTAIMGTKECCTKGGNII